MHNVQDLEQAIRQLSPDDLAAFRAWFIEFDAALWDSKLENDVVTGRLNKLAEEALSDLREGRCTDL